MSASFILVLLLIATIVLILKCSRIALSILIFTILCFIGIGNGIIPALLLNELQSPFINLPAPNWKNTNAIVLLGAGAVKLPITNRANPSIMAYSRINKAASLYFACINSHHKCKIIVSGGDAVKVGQSEAVVYQKSLIELGVNQSAIILEPNSLNTYKNAEFTSAILKKNQFDQVVLVTSGIHLKRSLLYFSNFGIRAIPAPADYLTSRVRIEPLGYNFTMTDFALHEYGGRLQFYIYNFFGWNKVASLVFH